jgi:hypothetical protein
MGDQAAHSRLYAAAWISTEANQDGKRILIRVRRISPEMYACAALPIVVTIEHQYESHREDGLPELDAARESYVEQILKVTAAIEHGGFGVHIYGDTIDGRVREWYYTDDVKKFAKSVREHAAAWFKYDLFYEEDPEWSHARGLLDQHDFESM